MATPLDTLKSWFRKGLYPTQSQFWAWLDSYWHKDEKIPMSSIDQLTQTLNKKADTTDLTNLQPTTDNTLETTDKTIVGAINELNDKDVDLSDYQAKEAPELNTEAKTIVEAINEVNSATEPLVINEAIDTANITANLAAHVHSVSYTGTATQLTISATNAAASLCSILAIINDTENDITVITPTTLDTLPVDSVQKQLSTVIKPSTATEYNFIKINNRLRLLIV